MRKPLIVSLTALLVCCGMVGASGDGSDEPGFVPPPHLKKLPSAPPRTSSSAETALGGGGVTPMSRTEAKKPPSPPVLVTKLKSETAT